MEDFLFALGVITPLMLIVAVGYLLKRKGLFRADTAKEVKKVVFMILIPTTVFLNIYNIEDVGGIDLTYVFFVAVVTLCVFFISIPLSGVITKDPKRRGVISQAMYRSNYALVGISLVTAICGENGGAEAALLSVVSVSMFNIFAVISLTVFKDGDRRIDPLKLIVNILKNPLIISVLSALVILIVRALFVKAEISFRLSDIKPIMTTVKYLSASSTPVALICLGAQFEFSAIKGMRRELFWGVFIRTVAVPAVGLGLAYLFFDFTSGVFAALIASFATPLSVSSAPMAQEMGSDGILAGQLVMWTTLVSALTLFGFIYALRLLGAF